MESHIAVLLIIFASILKVTLASNYYWQDFSGQIPQGAFVAGHDKRGPIYIGRVPFTDKVIPGKLYKDDPTIYFEFGEEPRTATSNIKIFCTKYPQMFEWIPTTNYQYRDTRHRNLLNGGYERGFYIHIGRVKVNEDVVNVGKIVCRIHSCLNLYTNLDGKNVEYNSYEALSFNATARDAATPVLLRLLQTVDDS